MKDPKGEKWGCSCANPRAPKNARADVALQKKNSSASPLWSCRYWVYSVLFPLTRRARRAHRHTTSAGMRRARLDEALAWQDDVKHKIHMRSNTSRDRPDESAQGQSTVRADQNGAQLDRAGQSWVEQGWDAVVQQHPKEEEESSTTEGRNRPRSTTQRGRGNWHHHPRGGGESSSIPVTAGEGNTAQEERRQPAPPPLFLYLFYTWTWLIQLGGPKIRTFRKLTHPYRDKSLAPNSRPKEAASSCMWCG